MAPTLALKAPIITLTTDFGLKDYFVGAVKGVLISRVPEVRLINISHDIPRHDVISGAFVINEAYRYFPPGTIHLVIVDPGVGTSRRKLIVEHQGHFFVAPDNGILSYILREAGSRVFEVLETALLQFKESVTFAGRDHFSPIAAMLAKGFSPMELGKEITDSLQIPTLFVKRDEKRLTGKIVYFDHYGNAISNLTLKVLEERLENLTEFTATVKGKTLYGIKQNYSEGQKGEGNLLINSSGYLEIFSLRHSVRILLKLCLMDDIIIN